MTRPARLQDYVKLHFVILLWGFTAVLGNLIEMSSTQLVLVRSVLATVVLAIFVPQHLVIPKRLAMLLLLNGMVLGFHWVLFFMAVKVANVSICMIGMATIAFWTALLEPLFNRKCRVSMVNLGLGLVVIVGMYWIFRGESEFHYGLIIALAGAVLATLFSIFNGLLAGQVNEQSVVVYEMAGAAIFCATTLVIASSLGYSLASDRWLPTPMEWVWLAILVGGGTILAYRMYVQLLDRLSVFTINFSNNLEPVYGITLGAIFFGDHQFLGANFYAGTVLTLAAVLVQPFLARRQRPAQIEFSQAS